MADSSETEKVKKMCETGEKKHLPLHNIVPKLFYREVCGRFQKNKCNRPMPAFNKLPGRLGFKLSSIVSDSTLQEGHVFLGFTKDGQFLLSYTQILEAEEHSAYPAYVYRLQSWRFIPNKPLNKVAESRLFGEEEIVSDLYLAVCQWPTDKSQILVYGVCVPNTGEEKKQCHITITAIPSLSPCQECQELQAKETQDSADELHASSPSTKCLQHGFVVHTKYELAPPFPSFSPMTFMKLDGVVLFNTGDSLIALNVHIGTKTGTHLYTPNGVSYHQSPRSSLSALPHDEPLSRLMGASQRGYSNLNPFEDSFRRQDFSPRSLQSFDDTVLSKTLSSPSSPYPNALTPYPPNDPYSPSNITSDSESDKIDYKPKNQLTDVRTTLASMTTFCNNVRKSDTSSQVVNPAIDSETSFTDSLCEEEVFMYGDSRKSCDANLSNKVFEDQENCSGVSNSDKNSQSSDSMQTSQLNISPGVPKSVRNIQDPYEFENSPDVASITSSQKSSAKTSQDIQQLEPNTNISFMSPTRPKYKPQRFEFTKDITINIPASHHKSESSSNRLGFELGRDICLSPSTTDGISVCSSCLNSPIILQSDSKCFTYSIRQYHETAEEEDGQVDMEDDLGLEYHSVLPLSVYGSGYKHMALCNSSTINKQVALTVRQLTLDVEQYIGETIRTMAEWGSRYVAFTDYDLQILDVCPENCSVIAMVLALVRAKPYSTQEHKCKQRIKAIPRLYRTGFKFEWNLQSGTYTTIDIDDLLEINQAELRGKQWNPCHNMCYRIQRQWKIPQCQVKAVNVLTNEAVFRGTSLRMLLDPLNYVAILL